MLQFSVHSFVPRLYLLHPYRIGSKKTFLSCFLPLSIWVDQRDPMNEATPYILEKMHLHFSSSSRL